MLVSSVETPCSLVHGCQLHRGKYRLHLRGSADHRTVRRHDPEDRVFKNLGCSISPDSVAATHSRIIRRAGDLGLNLDIYTLVFHSTSKWMWGSRIGIVHDNFFLSDLHFISPRSNLHGPCSWVGSALGASGRFHSYRCLVSPRLAPLPNAAVVRSQSWCLCKHYFVLCRRCVITIITRVWRRVPAGSMTFLLNTQLCEFNCPMTRSSKRFCVDCDGPSGFIKSNGVYCVHGIC